MGELIRRHPLIAYFALAYTGSWLVWAMYVLSLDGVGLLPFHAPASFLVIIGLGTFTGPALAAFVVTALTEGRSGVDRLIARILQWRVGLAWYLFAFLGLPAVEALGMLAMPGVLASFTPFDWWRELLAAAMFFVFPALFAGPLGEEIGWRVSRCRGCSNSTAHRGELDPRGSLGVLARADLVQGRVGGADAAKRGGLCVLDHPVTFIFTWVFNNTAGSVLMAILLHGTMDVFPNAILLPHLPAAGEMTSAGVLTMYVGLGSASA